MFQKKDKKKNKKPKPDKTELSESAKNYLSTRDGNVSKKIPRGQIIHTRDDYFYQSGGYQKKDKSGNVRTDNNRPAVVLDTNELDELALSKKRIAENRVIRRLSKR